MGTSGRSLAVLFLLPLSACASAPGMSGDGPAPAAAAPTVQPGAPGQSTRVVAAEGTIAQPRHSQADVRFMQGMIPHHAQALEMTALVPARTAREDLRLLARRIEISQKSEIALMERWLRDRGEPLPGEEGSGVHAHHGAHGADHTGAGARPAGAEPSGDEATATPSMHGMLTRDELDVLAAASGPEFERLFLEFMIRHHQGAVTMVAELFSTVGGGQESEVYQFASHVDSDQQMEIARMQRMLDSGG